MVHLCCGVAAWLAAGSCCGTLQWGSGSAFLDGMLVCALWLLGVVKTSTMATWFCSQARAGSAHIWGHFSPTLLVQEPTGLTMTPPAPLGCNACNTFWWEDDLGLDP